MTELIPGLAAPNRFQRMMQQMASLRPVAFVFRHTFHHVDKVAVRVLGGRTLSSVLGGVPNILLTTTGARSGKARTVPLLGVPIPNGAVAVIGTRFGHEMHPGWYHNLIADPRGTVEVQGRRTEVIARDVPDGPEYDDLMRRADALYSGFAHYRRRISTRRIPILVLDPVG